MNNGKADGKKDIRSMFPEELRALLADMGQPAYRAGQLFKWLQAGADYGDMTDIPKQLRAKLAEECYLAEAEVVLRLESKLDETRKYLLRLRDGEHVEAVLMSYHHGYSVCISTQVGCKMGCVFCATGRSGFSRDLTASEMIAQITSIQKAENVRISNVVLMGMGEPLDNYGSVTRFLKLLSHPDGVCIGQRHVSVSTCGLVDKIDRLIREEQPQFTLSVSLHAPNDRLRSEMMPVNDRWNIESLITACKRFTEATGRRISFEYSLVEGKNDSVECAAELAGLLRGMLCHVNLIPVNAVEGTGCRRSPGRNVVRFREELTKRGINATVRRTLGADIDASCGQLRRRAGADIPEPSGGKNGKNDSSVNPDDGT